IYSPIGSGAGSMTVIQADGGKGVALVSDFSTNKVTAVRFDQGFLNPSSGVSSVTVLGNSLLIDLHALEDCGNWYVFAIGYGGKQITRLDYLQDFVNPPVQTTFGTLPTNPYRIWGGREGVDFHLFISSNDGTQVR